MKANPKPHTINSAGENETLTCGLYGLILAEWIYLRASRASHFPDS